jgi:predicted nuclease with TOPRIM domain
MPFEVYDNDGNPVEGVLPPEEIKSLQEKLDETNEKLAKLENKDFNFRKLEEMTEAEKEKLSAAELALKKQQEELEEKQKSFETSFITDIKNDLLNSMAGEDEDLKKTIEANYNRLSDSATARSREQIKTLLNDAYVMSVGTKFVNPVLNANNISGNSSVKSSKTSDSVLEIGKKLGLSDEDMAKIKN